MKNVDLVSEKEHYFVEDISYCCVDYDEIFKIILRLAPGLSTLIDQIKEIPVPQWDEVEGLIRQSKEGNAFARERVINMYLKRVLRIALDMTNIYQLNIEDAISFGIIGLIKGVDKYDPDRVYSFYLHNGEDKYGADKYDPDDDYCFFNSYVSTYVFQLIKTCCKPRWIEYYFPIDIRLKLMHMATMMFERGYETSEDFKGKIRLPMETIEKYVSMIQSQMTGKYSLEDLLERIDDSTGMEKRLIEDYFIDYGADTTESLAFQSVMKEYVISALDCLNDREKMVLISSFGLEDGMERSLTSIGNELGLSCEMVCYIQKRAIHKMKLPSRLKKLDGII